MMMNLVKMKSNNAENVEGRERKWDLKNDLPFKPLSILKR